MALTNRWEQREAAVKVRKINTGKKNPRVLVIHNVLQLK